MASHWAELNMGIHFYQVFVEICYIFNVNTATIVEDTLNDFSIYGGFWVFVVDVVIV